jgi:hypothetical protein
MSNNKLTFTQLHYLFIPVCHVNWCVEACQCTDGSAAVLNTQNVRRRFFISSGPSIYKVMRLDGQMSVRSYTHYDTHRNVGHALAQAVSRRPVTAEARFRSRVSTCGICGGQSGTGTGLFPSTSVSPCQFHFIGAPLLGKTEEKLIITSAAGPFTTINKKRRVKVRCGNKFVHYTCTKWHIFSRPSTQKPKLKKHKRKLSQHLHATNWVTRVGGTLL